MTATSDSSSRSTEPAERRREPRVRALYHLVLAPDGRSREIGVTVGRTLDVSAAGVLLETPVVLRVDDRVRVEIAVEEAVVEADARVVRVARAGRLIEAGIEFTSITDTDRLLLTR